MHSIVHKLKHNLFFLAPEAPGKKVYVYVYFEHFKSSVRYNPRSDHINELEMQMLHKRNAISSTYLTITMIFACIPNIFSLNFFRLKPTV